jgi:isoleucyl-tRNA synthetase
MPFITEELWQRLPRRAADLVLVPSIMLASYPAASEEWAGEEVEREMALLQDITKCLRSARSNYGLTLKQKTAVYVSCNSDATAAVVSRGERMDAAGHRFLEALVNPFPFYPIPFYPIPTTICRRLRLCILLIIDTTIDLILHNNGSH